MSNPEEQLLKSATILTALDIAELAYDSLDPTKSDALVKDQHYTELTSDADGWIPIATAPGTADVPGVRRDELDVQAAAEAGEYN